MSWSGGFFRPKDSKGRESRTLFFVGFVEVVVKVVQQVVVPFGQFIDVIVKGIEYDLQVVLCDLDVVLNWVVEVYKVNREVLEM